MNKRQLVVMWVGIGLIVLMGVYPPWVNTIRGAGIYAEMSLGYHVITDPPSPLGNPRANGIKLDTPRLALQVGLVAVVSGGLLLSLKSRKGN